MKNETPADLWIWGFHAVSAALECHPEIVLEVQLEADSLASAEAKALLELLKQTGLKPKSVPRLPKFLADKRTQAVAAKLKSFHESHLAAYWAELEKLCLSGTPRQWILLDSLQDPRNFGALMRSAAAFGVAAVFIKDRHQCPPTGVVAQASAGNLFRVPLVECASFNKVIDLFHEHGAVILGLEAGAAPMREALKPLGQGTRHLVWVLGGEAKGIRPGLRERCTGLGQIPMVAGVESLNASTAAGIALFCGAEKLNTDAL